MGARVFVLSYILAFSLHFANTFPFRPLLFGAPLPLLPFITMLFRLPTSALLLALAVLTEASSHGHGAHLTSLRRHQLNHFEPRLGSAAPKSALNRRRSCRPPGSSISSTQTASTTKASTAPSKATSAPPSSGGDESGGSVAAGDFKPVKPADWPTATQAGAAPTSNVASASDPYLKELSKAYDNSGNHFFTDTHTGDMTYYGQGLGACGDVYDDNSFTAAVSHLMFDNWPGASYAQNRNPICGAFVPGRKAINNAGEMVSVIQSSISGYAEIGGDGLINCVGTPDAQCHIPLTATVTHGDKSIQVKIVDRCAACLEHDIDLTPAAFAALADQGLGRTSVTWKFDKW
ncbi:DPBB-1 domain-containing protein [Mycena venus]|uniref:DPBB-1 domain-containing protein n=1 Tax=Mycena venus TaxID=2733690 RepID=A0A8H6U1J0_9AGAR|nr:DPBB-1 domain-containing protein [Mycena venus]